MPVVTRTAILFVGLHLLGCGDSDELTRAHAGQLIRTQPEIHRLTEVVWLHASGFEKGERQGMWRGEDLLPRGQELLAEVSRSRVRPHEQLARPAIEVTGITDAVIGETLKEVEFVWTYTDLPPLLKRYVAGSGVGLAFLRRYDDGWRVEDVTVARSTVTPALLSPAERAADQQEEAEIAAEVARQRAEEERRAQLVQESQTPTRTVYQFGVNELTDVSVLVRYSQGRETQVWFRVIEQVQVSTSGRSVTLWIRADHRDFMAGRRGVGMYGTGGYVPLGFEEPRVRDEFLERLGDTYAQWRERFPELVTWDGVTR